METYNIILNSSDKISGDNNNAYFNIRWDTFLPDNYGKYIVGFSFTTAGGSYKNATYSSVAKYFDSGKLYVDFQTGVNQYDTTTNSQTKLVGCWHRYNDTSLDSASTSILKMGLIDAPPLTTSTPTAGGVNVKITDFENNLLVNTDTDGTTLESDMTNWVLQISFEPIQSSFIER